MRKLLVVMTMFSTAAISQTPVFTTEQRLDGENQIVAAGKILADNLRNPASARFRNVILFKTVGRDGREYVSFCGEVNGENGYGGMTGFQNFTTIGTKVLIGSTGILNADMVCNGTTPRVHDTRDYTPELRKAFISNAGQ